MQHLVQPHAFIDAVETDNEVYNVYEKCQGCNMQLKAPLTQQHSDENQTNQSSEMVAHLVLLLHADENVCSALISLSDIRPPAAIGVSIAPLSNTCTHADMLLQLSSDVK